MLSIFYSLYILSHFFFIFLFLFFLAIKSVETSKIEAIVEPIIILFLLLEF
jgi:hypothetical protein